MADNQEPNEKVEPAVEAAVDVAAGKQPAPDARAWVPEKLKGHKSLEKFKTVEDALTAHLNLESAYGRKFEENLKEDAPPEVKARVRAVLGVPESVDGYELAELPKGMTLDEGAVKSFKEIAHKAGLSKAQVKALSEWQINLEQARVQSGANERAEAQQKGMEALTKEWGAAASRNIALCQQVVSEIGGPDLAAYLNESGATNDPRMVKFLTKLGAVLAEDKLITPNPIGLTVDDAKKELADIRSEAGKDKKHPYLDRSHPDHKRVVQRVHELTQLANPEP